MVSGRRKLVGQAADEHSDTRLRVGGSRSSGVDADSPRKEVDPPQLKAGQGMRRERRVVVVAGLVSCLLFASFVWLVYGLVGPGSVVGSSADLGVQERKKVFLERHGEAYGYGGALDRMRATEFPHLQGSIYLDYTGAGMYQQSQLRDVLSDLTHNLYSNTHSRSPSAKLTEERVSEVRALILRWFHTTQKEYSVVFTSGATGALKLVGEMYPWTEHSEFVYMQENHNSVLGIREYALRAGGTFTCTSFEQIKSELEDIRTAPHDDPHSNRTFNLFAFPAESNFAGEIYPPSIIHAFHERGLKEKRGEWKVLLDAAAFAPTHRLDLSIYPADYVAISFYKMFGFPTGIGALLVRNEAAEVLQKTYFGGGTVVVATTKEHFHQLQGRVSSRLEDGTISFLEIIALKYGFNTLAALGMDAIQRHTDALARYLYESLRDLRHGNGKIVCEIYGNHHLNDPLRQGCIVNFNLLDPLGHYVGYYHVQTVTAEAGFSVRTGCLCNPGACYGSVQLTDSCVIQTAKSRQSCGDEMDIIDGRPAGAIRVSLGYANTFEDVDQFIQFMRKMFVDSVEGAITSIPTSLF